MANSVSLSKTFPKKLLLLCNVYLQKQLFCIFDLLGFSIFCFPTPSAAEAETRGRPRWRLGGDPLVTPADPSEPCLLRRVLSFHHREEWKEAETYTFFSGLHLGLWNLFLLSLGLAWGWQKPWNDSVYTTLSLSDGSQFGGQGGGEGGENGGRGGPSKE